MACPVTLAEEGLDSAIVRREHDGYWVWGVGTYPEGSVLAGQWREARLERYATLAEALRDYPGARIDD